MDACPVGFCAPGVTCGLSISQCGILVYGTLLISCFLWAMYFSHLAQYSSNGFNHTPIVVLKLPRSGSTWFTDTLNNYDNIFLSKEIVQRADGNNPLLPREAVEDHFIAALKRPMGKASSVNNIFPSSRFMDDYIFRRSLKPFRQMDIVGFTLNPEHSEGVDWARIAKMVPRMKVVVLGRSNVVKSAISGYTGSAIKSECGSSNLRAKSDCDPTVEVPWNTKELGDEVRQWQNRYDIFDQTINSNPALSTRIVHTVYYEELQGDPKKALRELFDALEMDPEYPLKGVSGESAWKKRSSDDLSQVLTHYDSIKDSFIRGNCHCLLEMLETTQPLTFQDRCKEVWRESSKQCEDKTGSQISQVSHMHAEATGKVSIAA